MYDALHLLGPFDLDAVLGGGVVDVASFVDVDIQSLQFRVQIRVVPHLRLDGLLLLSQHFLLTPNLLHIVTVLKEKSLF